MVEFRIKSMMVVNTSWGIITCLITLCIMWLISADSNFSFNIWGAQEIPEDWSTPFITDIQAIDGTANCPEGTRDLYNFDWLGTREAY